MSGEPSNARTALSATISGLAGGLLLALGVLLGGRWRLTGEHCAGAATAALVLGFSLPVLAVADPLLQPAGADVHITTARLLVVLPVLLLLIAGTQLRSWPLAPPLVAVAVFASWLAAIAALAQSPDHGSWMWTSTRAVELHGIVGVTWLVLAQRVSTGARDNHRPVQYWVAFSLAVMGIYSATQVWASLHRDVPVALGPLLQLAAAVAAVAAVGIELLSSLRAMTGRRLAVADSLGAVHALLNKTEQQHRQRVHDTHSAVLAIDAAARLLAENTGPMVTERWRIENLMRAELRRLQERLDPDLIEPVVEFSLAESLAPVLYAHQLCGAYLRCDLGNTRALGRPSATATVAANLLANARTHAPGARVDIHAYRVASRVVITIEDDGPGIPPRQRATLLRPGVRGSGPGPGSGLGLYTASIAMASQSGTLRLGTRPGGGTRVTLTLPAPLLSVAAGDHADVQAN